MFTQAELERANRDMQARLLTVSEQILRELSHLERQMESASAGVRASVLSATAQIASTQQRLREQANRLPASPLRRFQVLRSSLDAQSGALRQLSIIVQMYAPPRQPPSAPLAASPAVPAPLQPAIAPAAAADPVASALPSAHFEMLTLVGPPVLPEQVWEPFDGDPRDQAEPPPPSPRGSRRSRLSGAVERIGARSLALVAILAAGAVLSYGMFPHAGEPDAPAARRIALAPPGPSPVATPAPPPQPASKPEPVQPSALEEKASTAASAPPPPAPSPAGPPQPFMSGLVVTMPVPAAPAPAPAAAPPAPAIPAPAPPEDPARTASAPAAKPQFVPVVFTHKDDAQARRAFADLQRQYPKLLGRRQGEAQPVDLGKKGIWHRLVVLPPVARPQATRLCDQLLGAGYDRCWVKAY